METICRRTNETVHSGASSESAVWCHCAEDECVTNRRTTLSIPVEELMPCPFCGGSARYERMGTARHTCIIACNTCGCKLETGEIWSAGEGWNKRHAHAPSAGEETK